MSDWSCSAVLPLMAKAHAGTIGFIEKTMQRYDCLVTIALARIFLKERLTRKQHLSLAFLVVGIALLGISGFFNA